MSISSLVIPRAFPSLHSNTRVTKSISPSNKPLGLVVECSSRPQKKATAHHMKTRPRKSQPWDINRRPTAYAPLPPLPPDWTLIQSAEEAQNNGVVDVSGVEVEEADVVSTE